MLSFRKNKNEIRQAILIEKKTYSCRDDSQEIRKLYRMKWGMYNVNTSKDSKHIVYRLTFMTKKGEVIVYVDNVTYHSIKIDSLGTLTTNKELFVSFLGEKIANEEDVRNLNW